MRNLILLLALAPAAVILGYILLSPAYLGDYRWLLITLPISLAIARELYEHTRGAWKPKRQLIEILLQPLEEDADQDESADQGDDEDINGLWTGTLNIWPSKPDEVLQLLPVQLLITDEGQRSYVISRPAPPADARIVGARVLEYDRRAGHLDVEFVVQQGESPRTVEARLTTRNGKLVPHDASEVVTVELQRAVPVVAAI
jgi:hypothetical protein